MDYTNIIYIIYNYGFDTFKDYEFFLAFLVRGYGCSTSHTIVPFTIGYKFRTFSVAHSLAYINKEPFKTVYVI